MSDKPGADASTVKSYKPLRNAYVHGDVTTAAEDTVYIFAVDGGRQFELEEPQVIFMLSTVDVEW